MLRLYYLSPLIQCPHRKIFPKNRPQDSKVKFQLKKQHNKTPDLEAEVIHFVIDLGRCRSEYLRMGNRKEKKGVEV